MSDAQTKTPLQLPEHVKLAMIEHTQKHFPKEACGFLIADEGNKVVRIQSMHNVEDSPIGYSMEPKEQLLVEKDLRQRKEKIIGIYHSHTASDAYPSSVDVRLAISPDISYILVSLKDRQKPVVKSYRIEGEAIIAEPIQQSG